MESKETHFQNDHLDIQVEEREDCRVQFRITVHADYCQEEQSAALKTVQKKVDLPGFRKGRVPPALVQKHFSEAIQQECQERVMQNSFSEACSLTGIHPWNIEEISPPDVTPSSDQGITFNIQFERTPVVPLVDASCLHLPSDECIAPSDTDIDNRIQGLAEQNGTFTTMEGKKAEDGDYVRITLSTIDEPQKSIVEDERIKLDPDPNNLTPWVRTIVLGMSAHETREGTTAPNPEASEEERANFSPQQVRVSVLAVENYTPPSDEELCQALGVESMAALRERVHKQLVDKRQHENHDKQRTALWEQLIKTYPFALPSSLVEKERKNIFRSAIHQLRQTTSEQELLQKEQMLALEAERFAQSNLARFFLSRELIKSRNEEPSDHEVLMRAVQLMLVDRVEMPSPTEREQLWNQYRETALYELIIRKAEEILLKEASEEKTEEPSE